MDPVAGCLTAEARREFDSVFELILRRAIAEIRD
jgi:hypothetical protein